jgi:hypothetical protein
LRSRPTIRSSSTASAGRNSGWAELDEAEKYLRQAMEQRPDPENCRALGEVLWAKGERARAQDRLAVAVEERARTTLCCSKRFAGSPVSRWPFAGGIACARARSRCVLAAARARRRAPTQRFHVAAPTSRSRSRALVARVAATTRFAVALRLDHTPPATTSS